MVLQSRLVSWMTANLLDCINLGVRYLAFPDMPCLHGIPSILVPLSLLALILVSVIDKLINILM